MLMLGNVQASLSLLSLNRIFHVAKLEVFTTVGNRYEWVFLVKVVIIICGFVLKMLFLWAK
jgi:hypothetical protein